MANPPDFWRDLDRPLASFASWRPLLGQLDELFNEALGTTRRTDDSRTLIPSVDLEETDDHYLLSFDMPGLEKKDIDIEVQGNQLVVTGERKDEREGGSGRARFVERRYGTFQRTLTLPEGISADKVEAQYRNGVLTVAVSKPTASKRQKVEIAEGKSGGLLDRLLGNGGRTAKETEKGTINVKASERSTDSPPAH